MTKRKLKTLTETVISPFVSIYKGVWEQNGKSKSYDFASRTPGTTTSTIKQQVCNAATIFVFNKDKSKMLLIKEFRYPIDDYVIASPAGLIDDNESSETTALRELFEEVGYTKDQITIDKTLNPSYSSVGLTNEMVSSVFVRVSDEKLPPQNLDGDEDITPFWITPHDAETLLTTGVLPHTGESIGITARTQLVLQAWINEKLPSREFRNVIDSL